LKNAAQKTQDFPLYSKVLRMREIVMSIKSRFAHVVKPGCHFLLRSFSAMPRNIEIKAKLPNPTESSEVAKTLSGKEGKSRI